MEVIKIENKRQLDDFVDGEKHSQFLQSWDWGEFQERVSGKTWRLGIEEEGRLVAAAKIIRKGLPMGKSYFYCARGPIISAKNINDKAEIQKLIFEKIAALAKSEGAMFLRFDPIFELSGLPFPVTQTLDVQPSQTLILDLSKTDDELLKEMHQKTRYNIRLAEKKGVRIIEGDSKNFEDFWRLLDQTSDRDQFRPHGRSYYEEMLKVDPEMVKLLFARYGDKFIATGIFAFFGDTATYLHGGSSNESREVMAPYLLQWQAIQAARAAGCKFYDFQGIDEEKWPGVTRFKKGFGGQAVHYPGTFDLIFDQGWYNIYKMVRQVRRTF